MKNTDAAWLAGFLDGEGSFMVTREIRAALAYPCYDAVICATNTNRRLVEKCAEIACCGKIVTTIPKNSRHRDAHIWTVKGPRVAPLATALLPWLVSKSEQARLLIELRAIIKLGSPKGRFGTRKTPEEAARRAALYDRCQALNRRGNPEYAAMARKRIIGDATLFAEVAD